MLKCEPEIFQRNYQILGPTCSTNSNHQRIKNYTKLQSKENTLLRKILDPKAVNGERYHRPYEKLKLKLEPIIDTISKKTVLIL